MEILCNSRILQCLLMLLLVSVTVQGIVELQIVENSPTGQFIGLVESNTTFKSNFRFALASYRAI